MQTALNHLATTLNVDFAQHSEAGIKAENQDTIGARIPEGNLLVSKGIAIAIADGVSSSNAAKEASQTAVTGFLNDYYATPETWSTQRSVCQVVQSLNRYLWSLSQNNVRQEGYLTTLSLLVLKGTNAFSFHVGDSRIYHIRDKQLEQVTRDHTQVINRDTRYLSRALGADLCLEIEMHIKEVRADDIFLLTTDGVHDFIRNATLLKYADDYAHDMSQLVDTVTAQARQADSNDNISIQACRIRSCSVSNQADAFAALSSLPFPPPLEIGQTLDGLKVDSILHESERSQVYLVKDQQQRMLAMKTPAPKYADDPAYIERFILESWVGARIQNPHVVKVVEPPSERNFLYYLTEYTQGPTLGQIIQQRAPLAIQDAVELMEQIIRGIRAFHRRDTLHQDIKPDNIIVNTNGAVIIDFGSCWVAGIDELKAPFIRDQILGTLEYAAPEYTTGGARSPRSDQFSLAIIFYELVTGKKPYGERYNQKHDIKGVRKLTYCPASRHNPLVPYWIDKAIEKAASIDSNQRYAALSEWLQDLKRPNPQWDLQGNAPFLQRRPLLFWQILAGVGWLAALVLLFVEAQSP